MSGSYRGKLAALGLSAALLFSVGTGAWLYSDASQLQATYEHLAEKKADAYADRARVTAERRCLPLPSESERECIREEAQTARQGEHDEYDLQAQLVTSVWTRAMGIAAIIGMAVGILGVGLIFVTFRETQRTANSAEESLQHSRDVSFDQLRAYVGISHIEDELEDVNGKLRFRTQLKNYGQTPATEMSVHFKAFYVPFPVPGGPPEIPEGTQPLRSNPLMPGQTRYLWTQGLSLSKQQELAIATYRACVLTRLELAYTTIGGTRIECAPIIGIYYPDSGGGTARFNEGHLIGGSYPDFNASEAEPDPDDQANQPPLL